MLSLKNKILMSAATIGLLSAGGVATVAKAQDSYMPSQNQQQQQMNVSDAQLQKFAKADQAIRQMQSKFQSQSQGVESQEEMQAIQQKANKQMVQAIEQTGLSIQEYKKIGNVIRTNPEVQKKYMNMVQ